MNDTDTRLINCLGDAKAGVAAWDDCRTALSEYLDEGPNLPSRERVTLTALRDAMNLLVDKGDGVIGSLTRTLERPTS